VIAQQIRSHASLSLCGMLISGVSIGILVSSLMVRSILFPRLIIVVVILIVCLILYLTPIPLSSALKQHLFPTFITKITGASMPSPVSGSAFAATPKLSQLTFHIREYSIPGNNDSIPLYPLYDKNQNVIWVGDTQIDSSRLLEFNLTTGKFIEHKLNGTSIVTVMAFNPNNHGQIWYVDPLLKRLGQYYPSANTTKLYNIPSQGTISRIAIDLNNNVWLTSPDANELLRFNTQTKSFSIMHLPTIGATPIGILVDKASGIIWIAEGVGKLASIDPTRNYKITEYPVITENNTNSRNNTHYSPTELFNSPFASNIIYISDHDNHTVSVFNTTSKTFKAYPVFNPNALPFGMAMDKNGYLWIAEHTTNKVAVIDPKTGSSREVEIPKPNPYVQFITSDSKGNIWLSEQLGNSLGVITSSPTS
jgi:copper transport protein